MRLQIFLWAFAFLTWYHLFVSFYLPYVSQSSWPVVVVELCIWIAIWLTAIASLTYASFTRPARVPAEFNVPHEIFAEEAKAAAEAQSPLLEDNTDDSDASPPVPNGWEYVYHRIAALVRERDLDVRLNPIGLSDGKTIMCPSFCRICKVIKPSRAHHCRRCDQCILRLDHHCPSLGACVHLHNHKFFLVFLAWATALCFYGGTVALCTLFSLDYGAIVDDEGNLLLDPFPEFFALTITGGGVLTALVCPMILIWFQYTLWRMLLRNDTSLESQERDTYGPRGMYGNGMPVYDKRSKRANLETVFGKNVWLWAFPVPSAPTDTIT